MRLLVVDDDSGISTLLVALFNRHGFVVDCAFDGEEATRRIRSADYDVILLDLMLPRMNGFEVIRELRSWAPRMIDRTIVITAAADTTIRHFDSSDVFRLIRKPFDLQELVDAVRACAGLEASATAASFLTSQRASLVRQAK